MLDVPQTTHSEEDDTTVTEKQSKNRKNRRKINAEKQHIKTEKEGVMIDLVMKCKRTLPSKFTLDDYK